MGGDTENSVVLGKKVNKAIEKSLSAALYFAHRLKRSVHKNGSSHRKAEGFELFVYFFFCKQRGIGDQVSVYFRKQHHRLKST